MSDSPLRVKAVDNTNAHTKTHVHTHTRTHTQRCIVQTLLEGANPLANQHSAWAVLHCSNYTHAVSLVRSCCCSTCTCDERGEGGGPVCMSKCGTRVHVRGRGMIFQAWALVCCEPLTGKDQPQTSQSVKERKKQKHQYSPNCQTQGRWDNRGGDLDTRTRIQTWIKADTVIIQGLAGR